MDFRNRNSLNRRGALDRAWIFAAGLLALIILSYFLHKHRGRPEPVISEKPVENLIVSSGTIGSPNGSLTHSLNQKKLSSQEILNIEIAIKPFLRPGASRPSDQFEIFQSTSGRFVRLNYFPNKLEFYTVEISSTGAFMAQVNKIPTTDTLLGADGQIHDSLWRAMSAQKVPPEMIIRFAELFGWRFDFLTEARQGDTYKIIWSRRAGNGTTQVQDTILSGYYHSHEKGDFYAFPLAGDYFDQQGDSLRGEFLRAPLSYRRISSYFTEHRFHPILRYWRPHHGIDYSAPRGTPVVSIGEGVVTDKGYKGGLGNEIRIRHAGSYATIYGHLMGYARGLHVGSHIKQGELIGYVGSTGLSTGPHLHFGFESGGKLVDFFHMKLSNNHQIVPPAARAHFDQIKQEYLALLNRLTQPGAPFQMLSEAVETRH